MNERDVSVMMIPPPLLDDKTVGEVPTNGGETESGMANGRSVSRGLSRAPVLSAGGPDE